MPVSHEVEIREISNDEFQKLDYKVTGLAFSIHQEMGRFWSENIYQNELSYRCQQAGIADAATEVPIHVSYKDFSKTFYVDLLINNAMIYELKTAQAISNVHCRQVLDYLFLLNLSRGKIINMQPPSVEHRFVSTRLTLEKRLVLSCKESDWQDLDKESIRLKGMILELLNEWGAFLGTGLFYQAICHFLGREEQVISEIEVVNNGHRLGTQKMHMINPDVAFRISSITKGQKYYADNLRRFVRFASLKALQWINFNHHQIEFKTILPEEAKGNK